MITDFLGRPTVLALSPGNRADIRMAGEMLHRAGRFSSLIADRADDADALRDWLEARGIHSVIPAKSNRIMPLPHNPRRYRERWRIEAAIGRLKDFRRVATRYDKLARTFNDALILAAIVALWI